MDKPTKLGMVTAFAVGDKDKDDDKNKGCIALDDDGTLTLDIFRTGVWRHRFYGTLDIKKDYLDSLIENFDKNILGNQIYFDYNHDHDRNFAIPIQLFTEERQSTFTGRKFTVLRAKVRPTPQGLKDANEGQVLNFSSEISDDYIHREMMPITVINEDGTPATDANGEVIEQYVARRFGPTLVGGAVTNNPFITDLNPNGIGGNLGNYKYSIVANDETLTKDNFASKCFSSTHQEDASAINQEEADLALSSVDFDTLMALNADKHVIFGNCIYDASEYRAGDVSLPDSAFAIVIAVSGGKDGKSYKIRKLAHHTAECKDGSDNSTLDKSRFDFAMSKTGDAGISPIKFSEAIDHLTLHKTSLTYSNVDSETSNVDIPAAEEAHRQMSTEHAPGAPPPKVDEPQVLENSNNHQFGKTDVEAMIALALSTQKAELDMSLSTLRSENEALRKVAHEEANRAYSAHVDGFVSKLAGGAATPAFQKVIKCGLVGNKGLVLKYQDPTTNEFSDITLEAFVDKIAATADFDNIDAPTENNTAPNVPAPIVPVTIDLNKAEFTSEEVLAITKDPGLFRAFIASNMTPHSGYALAPIGQGTQTPSNKD